MNEALIIIDMINDGFEGWDPSVRQRLALNINALTDFFRGLNLPIIWVRQEFEANLTDAFLEMRKHKIKKYIKNTDGVKILSELKITDTDLQIVKKRYSAFFNTDLDKILAEKRCRTLFLAGINTHACVRATAVDAYQRDFETVLAVDCIQSYNSSWHQSSLDYMNGRIAILKTSREIFETLK